MLFRSYIDHGIGGKNGHITDEVFHRKVLSARDTGRAQLDRSLRALAARVRSAPEKGTPLTVFNTLAWTRSAPVEWEVPDGLAAPLRVTDAKGREIPAQLSASSEAEEVNVAASAQGAKATASSAFSADYGAEKAIDGRWAVRDPDPALGGSDKWNSAAASGPHWLTVDFGQPRTIHRVAIRHEGVIGAFQKEACDNTADFQIQGAASAEGPWADLVPPVTNNTASLSVHTFAPTPVRFLKLTVTKGTQADNAYARIYEVQAFAKTEARRPRLVFVAPEVPSIGYKTFYVSHAAKEAKPGKTPEANDSAAENAFFRLALAPGGIRSLYDKEQRRELLKTDRYLGGELFTMLSVAPDNRRHGTDAGEFGAVPQPVMDASFDRVASHRPAWRLCEQGPVRAVFELEQPLAGARARQRVTLWHTLKRLDVETELNEFDGRLWREFRVAFPLALAAPAVTYEVPMGVVRIGKDEIPTTGGHAYGKLDYYENCADIRPREMQNFVDASDAKGGVTLSADVSVFDWRDPATNEAAVVLQPVLLATRKSCNGEGNWYPQAGDHRYRFSLTSHAGDWRKGWRAGVAANAPFEVVSGVSAAADAALPAESSFLSLTAPNATVCTVKKAEDDGSVIVRLVEMEGRDSQAVLQWLMPVREAWHANIIEDAGEMADVWKRTLRLPLGHHAIETARLSFGPAEGER